LAHPIQTIKDLTQSALGDINAAATLADLEKVRVDVLVLLTHVQRSRSLSLTEKFW
jgi:hypothetical protein